MSTPALSNAPIKNSMGFENWVERLRNHAFEKGVSVVTLQNTFLQNKQLDLRSLATLTPLELNEPTLQTHLALSRSFLTQYSDTLFEISHLFGVDSHVIVAIASIEHQHDTFFPAIDILINRSFQQPKNTRLQNELIQALKIIDDGQISIEQLQSDLQGKLGKTRFKPTIFREYAIDYDTDGQYDIWQNYVDIFASTANYLSNLGWQTGETWGVEVLLPEAFDLTKININQQKNINQWRQLGIFQADGNELPDSVEFGALTQIGDKHYLVLDNYFALLRWRRSATFAYDVGQLIDLMKPSKTFDDIPLSEQY